MEKNNLLNIAIELEKKKEWVELHDIILSYFEPDDDEWKELIEEYLDGESADEVGILTLDQMDDLAAMRIECIIKVIDFEKFSGKFDEEKNLILDDECKGIGEMLENAIFYMTGHCIDVDGDHNKTVDKINKYRHQSHQWAKEHFLSMIDLYFDNVSCDSRDKTNLRVTDFHSGFNLVNHVIFWGFLGVWDALLEGVGEDEDFPPADIENKWREEIEIFMSQKWHEKSLEISKAILEQTTDYPYYDNMEVGYMYNAAEYAARSSLKLKNLPIEPEKKVAYLKQRVNNLCNYLNAIIVKNGHQGTILQAGRVRDNAINDVIECEKQIQEIEPDYKRPDIIEGFSTIPENKGGGGCYVATAVYGSYNCPEVWTLRRFRDNTLAKTWYGRSFIRLYYATSPSLVRWFGGSRWFKAMWKPKLDRMVADLQAKGVKSTPYEDKKW